MTTGTETVSTDNGGLTASEAAFFETGGATDPAATPDTGAGTGAEADGAEANDPAGAETGQANGKDPKKNSMVPHGALHEERQLRKAAEGRAREVEIENARFRERFTILAELNGKNGQPAKPVAPPDPETDFVGAIKHQGETLAQMQERLDRADAQTKEAGELQQLVRAYAASVNEYKQTTPDFQAAYAHLLNSRAEELSDLGYPQDAIHATLQQEELSIASIAMQNKKNPGEVIYALAKRRGYQKADAAAPGADTANKLDVIERGQQSNKTLSSAGGASGDLEMTAERLLKMSDTDYLSWIDKNPDKARRLGVA